MTDKNASASTSHHHAKAAADNATAAGAMFSMVRTEMLTVADESEKMVERSLVEVKRATVESSRLWESQLELSASMTRAAFDGVRRMWNV